MRTVRRPRLRSLRNKLALLFFAITAAAFSVIYFYVVPQSESNLREERLDDLERAAARSKSTLESLMGRRDVSARELDRRVRALGDATGARVTLQGVQRSGDNPRPQDLRFFTITDSREETRVPENRPLAAMAVLSGESTRGSGRLPDGELLGELAQPLSYRGRIDWVALYSRSFEDVGETVAFIRSRLLAATAAALLLALIGGYLVAQAVLAPREAAGGGRARGGGGQVHGAAAGGVQRRAGPAHAHVQRDAGAAAPSGRGA